MTLPLLVRPSEAARLLEVSRAKLYRLLANEPTFPQPVRLGPKTVRFRRSDIEAWVAGGLTDPNSTAKDETAKCKRDNEMRGAR